LLIVGVNPSLRSAEVGRHFARPGNRFWPALAAAGITPRRLDPAEQDELAPLGIGITNFVPRPTVRADEISRDELRAGAGELVAKLERGPKPAVVAVLGLFAYRTAFDRPRAVAGRQPDTFAGVAWWLLPNPSGLNAHTRPADHAAGVRAAAEAAGVV
jgi:TDG/mug DNA glycosylase family protein